MEENGAEEREQRPKTSSSRIPEAACIVCSQRVTTPSRLGPGSRCTGPRCWSTRQEYRSWRRTGPTTRHTLPTPPPKLKTFIEGLRGRVTITQCSVLLNIPAKAQGRHKWRFSEALRSPKRTVTITVQILWCARTRTHTQLANHSRAANLKKELPLLQNSLANLGIYVRLSSFT